MKTHVLPVLALSVLICSCSAEVTPNANQQPSTAPQSSPTISQSVASENGMLTANPGVINLCEVTDEIISSHVSWDASSATTEGVEVWLQGKEEAAPKLWSADGPVGNSTTGKWLQNGHRIILIDGASKSELARINIKAVPCNN